MGMLDQLSALMGAAPMGGEPPTVLTPPAAVQPRITQVKPRINPPAVNPGNAGDMSKGGLYSKAPIGGGSGASVPRLGPAVSQAASPGDKPSFRDRAQPYLQDFSAGIQNVRGGSAISAFAQGFAGAVLGRADRKASAAKTALDADDRAFDRKLKTDDAARADRRLKIEETDAATKRLLDETGNLTAAGVLEIEERTDKYATSLGLKGTTLLGSEREAAQAKLEAYRKQLEENIVRTGKLPREPAAGGPGAGAAATKSDRGPVGGKDQARLTPSGAPAAAAPVAEATIEGQGSREAPYRFTSPPKSAAEFQSKVPMGAYYVIVDPATGQESLYRRTK